MPGLQLIYDKKRRESVSIPLPLSKSMAARALIISAWAGRQYDIEPFCTDTAELSKAISDLLKAVPKPAKKIRDKNHGLAVADFDLGLGGTSLRFFVSLAASIPGLKSTVTCDEALRRRPMNPLFEALSDVGAEIKFLTNSGYPPVSIMGRNLEGGTLCIGGSVSSQFASSLMMAAPYWSQGLTLQFKEHPVSASYIGMTVEMMRRAGAEVEENSGEIRVSRGEYESGGYPDRIEGDWSAASYFYELALLAPGREIRLANLVKPGESVQGDSRCVEIFNLFGVETRWSESGEAVLKCDRAKRDGMVRLGMPVELDMNSTPDLVPALAVGLCLSGIRYRMSGVSHLRHKESDRLSVLKLELEKIGFALEMSDGAISWEGKHLPKAENETIEPYGDHRIAMAFAAGSAALPYLSIENPRVVEKSYPDFFEELTRLGFHIRHFGR